MMPTVHTSVISVVAVACTVVLLARAAALHRPRLVLTLAPDLPGLLLAAAGGALALSLAGGVRSTAQAVTFGAVMFAALAAAHATVLASARATRRRAPGRRVLLLGTGDKARNLAEWLQTCPELSLRPTGFVATGNTPVLDQARGLSAPLIGTVDGLPRAMVEAQVDGVVVALDDPPGDAESAAILGLLVAAVEVYVVPDGRSELYGHAHHRREVIDHQPLVRLYRRELRPATRAARRVANGLASALALLAVTPLLAVLAILVRAETGGYLVRHEIRTPDGRFTVSPRFRTRRARSVARPGTTFSVAIAGRVGYIGRMLRRTRLDLLPAVALELSQTLSSSIGRGVRHGDPAAVRPTTSPRADQPKVDAGQLAR